MHRPQPILSAATSLLGICFVIITSLKLTGSNARSLADEVAWAAAALLFAAVGCAYLAIRNQGVRPVQIRLADGAFLCGISALALSVIIAAIWL